MQFSRTLWFSAVLVGSMMVMGFHNGYCQVTDNQVQSIQTKNAPDIYGHVFGGMGFSYLSADDVKSVIGDDFGVGIGLPTWSYGARVGFRHLLQVEYNIGKADHDFNNNSIIKDIPNEVIKMDYKTNDVQFKVNPVFWKPATVYNGSMKAFFLVYGFGDIEWRDKNDDGFEGSSVIYGVEWARISKHASFSVSFKRYDIEFDETTIFNIPFKQTTNASDYILEVKIGFGLGV